MLPSSVGKKIILKEVFPIAGITWKKGTSLATWNGPSLTNYLSQIFLFFYNSRYWHILAPLIYTYHGSLRISKQVNTQKSKRKYQQHHGLRARPLSARLESQAPHLPSPLPHPCLQGPVSTRFHLYLSNRTTSVQTCCCLIKARDSVHLDRLPRSGQIRSSGQIPGSPLHHFLSPSIDFKKRVSHKHSKENK